MSARYLIICVFLFLPYVSTAQSVSVKTVGRTSGNGPSTFSLQNGNISVGASSITLDATGKTISGIAGYGISSDLSLVGILRQSSSGSEAGILDSKGLLLSQFPITRLASGDPSIAIYPFLNGAALVRDNIANFNFYDSFGEVVKNISNSSQSKGGEAISEVAADPAGQTVVLYSPKVKRAGTIGSVARLVGPGLERTTIFSDNNRTLKEVSVSQDGQFIILVVVNKKGSGTVEFMDRYGNTLHTIQSDEKLEGAVLSSDAQYITLYSSRRVIVYDSMSGKRMGSTSFRYPVVTTSYFPADHTVVAMTGRYNSNSGIANDVKFHVIDLKRRKVARQTFSGGLVFNPEISMEINREGKGRYILKGANKEVEIRFAY